MSQLLVPDKDPHLRPRKLSDMSTASNQTHQLHHSQASVVSHGLSVVISPTEPDVRSNVLLYVQENLHEFDPDDLFQQRQHRFVTAFGQNYDSAETDRPLDVSLPIISPDRIPDLVDALPDRRDADNYHDSSDDYSEDFDDDVDDYPYEDDDDDDDDMLPPSPPRSPPRELDPDKLYGLYDFSGPDPLHCSISRDEPVYLINDQDNYWWLVRKLTKDEKLALRNQRSPDTSDDEDDVATDEEDGKVGFVPAECLETFGERLARLNCFKNEELEKSARDLLDQVGDAVDTKENSKAEARAGPEENDVISSKSNQNSFDQIIDIEKSNSSLGLGSPVMFQNSPNASGLSRSGSILKNGSRPLNINKSVTFEDLNDLVLDENNEDSSILDEYESTFPAHYYNLPVFEEPKADEEKRSEVLSDVYPTETPLVINKRNSAALPDKPFLSPYHTQSEEKQWDDYSIEVSRASPKTKHSSGSEESIPRPVALPILSPESVQDYYTPRNMAQATFDALPGSANGDDNDDFKTPINNNFNSDSRNSTPASERLRRSVILDRLAQVTTDIEQELDMEEYDSYYDQSRFLRGIELTGDSSAPSSRALTQLEDKAKILPTDGGAAVNDDGENSGSELDDYIAQSSRIHNGDEFDEDFADEGANVTPLTSVNSLSMSNGAKNVAVAAPDVAERRKSKPVHDMFVPILGKFDELAERLAEIDEML